MTKKYVMATWDDAPHLSEEAKKSLWDSYPVHMRDARAKGVPQLGAGAIYPIGESEITVEPFDIPPWWPRAYGMDVGWNRTAAVWGAIDYEADVMYLYSEYYRGQAEPPIHSYAVQSRGEWIPGLIDPAARGRGQKDGEQLLDIYLDLGLNLYPADNRRESGLYNVWQAMSTGRLKVFPSLRNWLSEFRIYRRDDKGAVVKEKDHLMDCTRYLFEGRDMAMAPPVQDIPTFQGPTGRDLTGY